MAVGLFKQPPPPGGGGTYYKATGQVYPQSNPGLSNPGDWDYYNYQGAVGTIMGEEQQRLSDAGLGSQARSAALDTYNYYQKYAPPPTTSSGAPGAPYFAPQPPTPNYVAPPGAGGPVATSFYYQPTPQPGTTPQPTPQPQVPQSPIYAGQTPLPNLNTTGVNPYMTDPLMSLYYGLQNPLFQGQQQDFYGDPELFQPPSVSTR